MKKTLLALTVAAFATSAQAQVELYKDDASSVKVKGQIATFAYQKDIDYKAAGAADFKSDLDVNVSAKAQFDFEHKVTDTLVAGGTFEIQSKSWIDESNNDAEFDDVAAYLKGDFGLVGIGEIGDVSDSNDAVTKTDILNELANNYNPGEFSAADKYGHGVSFTKEFGAVTAVVDAYTESNEHVDNTYGVSVNYQGEIFSVGAMYQTQGDTTATLGAADEARDSWALAADFTAVENLTLAAAYNVVSDEATGGDVDTTNITFSASYAATDAVSLYGVYGNQDIEGVNFSVSNADEIILGASYAASDLLTVFTEVASRTNQAEDETTEILVGAYFDF